MRFRSNHWFQLFYEIYAALLRHLLSIFLLPFLVVVVVPDWLLTTFAAGDTRWSTGSPFAWLPRLAGVALVAAGLALFAWCDRLFATVGKGTLAPWDPARKLVAVGPYRFLRNPMISGVALMLVGQALFWGSWVMSIWSGVFFNQPPWRYHDSHQSSSTRRLCAHFLSVHPIFTHIWSPDGEYIAYRVIDYSKRDSFEIHLMKADGSQSRQLADLPGNEILMGWSPDGEKILFGSIGSGYEQEIYSVRVDGSALTKLTDNHRRNDHSAYSPDGRYIAFISNMDESSLYGPPEVYLMDADGQNVRRLTHNTERERTPV